MIDTYASQVVSSVFPTLRHDGSAKEFLSSDHRWRLLPPSIAKSWRLEDSLLKLRYYAHDDPFQLAGWFKDQLDLEDTAMLHCADFVEANMVQVNNSVALALRVSDEQQMLLYGFPIEHPVVTVQRSLVLMRHIGIPGDILQRRIVPKAEYLTGEF